ncbi:MAG: hypothetical protein WBG86_02750 [Polyangiales bacterium]
MAHNDLTQAPQRRGKPAPELARTGCVVHDGSAFELSASLRQLGFDIIEGPLLSFAMPNETPRQLAVIATKPGAARAERLQSWTRELCSRGTTVLAIGASVGPVAEFFGSQLPVSDEAPGPSRLANITTADAGLFVGVPESVRLAVPTGPRFLCDDLNAEFGVTANAADGELIGASHVFRPIHLLHASVVESAELRPTVLANLLRLVRDQGGRAF